jgi:hypothetical protein
LAFVLSAALIASPAFATRTHRATSGVNSRTSHKPVPKSASHRLHGQQAIEPARVTEIQQALIREHYLNVEANGKWDATTDSRALKKLGLGPDYSTAINAKTATFVDPPPVSTIPADQAAGFVQSAHLHQ